MEVFFKGIKQAYQSTYDSASVEDKKAFLWLVRENAQDTYGKIYFGNRCYGVYDQSMEYIDNIFEILSDAGIVDETGNTVDIASMIEDAQLVEGSAITIYNGVISVNVADETANSVDEVDTNKNFLKLNSNNELEVSGVDTDATVTSSDITIAGGPLAELALEAYSNGKIPSGTSIQDFLVSMLCVEKWAESVSQHSHFSVSVAAPTITLTSSNSTQEVGSTVTMSSVSPKTSSASQYISASTFDYGYKIGETKYTSNKYTQTLTPTVSNNDVSLTVAYVGFNNATGQTVTNENLPQTALTITEGTNKVTVSQSGKTYTASSNVSNDDIYIATNLGNYYQNDKTTDNVLSIETPTAWTNGTTAVAMNSANKTITGARKYFYGYLSTPTATITSETIRGLQYSGWTSSNSLSLVTANGTRQVLFAFPASANKTLVKVTDRNASEAAITGNFEKQSAVNVSSANNFDSVAYDVWSWTPSTDLDANTYTITLS